jgi:hypothetical protein
MHNLTDTHVVALKCILRYLKGTANNNLMFSIGNLEINAFFDADYVGNLDDRRSFDGFCVFLGSNSILRCVKK